MTFSKLFGYYGSKGIVLNEGTFVKNLGLRNAEGEYNMLAQLLSDNSHINKTNEIDGDRKPLNSRRKKILTEMRDNPNITSMELQQILGISVTAVENNISFLKENGYIERVGSKKKGYWKILE